MKIVNLLFLIFSLIPLTLFAQDFDKKFGVVNVNELKEKTYPKDKTAEAAVIYDVGESSFVKRSNGYEVIFKRKTRIKIYSSAGIKHAKIAIPFYREGNIFEKVYEIEGYTYNLNNGNIKKQKLKVNNCYNEKINENWYLKKFAMPKVREGSIIEYRYKIKSEHIFNLRDWKFQRSIPTAYSKYKVRMIPFYQYHWYLQGRNAFDSQTSYTDDVTRKYGKIEFQDRVHNYVMKDIPAFKDEKFISSVNDYIVKLSFQLSKIIYPSGGEKEIVTTWPDLIEDFIKEKSFGKYLKKCRRLAKRIINLDSLKRVNEKDRFNHIVSFVKNNYKWNGNTRKNASKSHRSFKKDNFGNTADINLFLTALLREAEIKAYPVLISTRKHGKIKTNYPYNHFFNNVIVTAKINNNFILTDATEPLLENNKIPLRCINDIGLIINEQKVDWIKLHNPKASLTETKISIDSLASSYHTNISISANQYDAFYYRNKFGNNKNKILEKISEKDYNIIENSLSIKNPLKPEYPYIIKYSLKNNPEVINNKIYISPFLAEIIDDNPLKQETRKHHLDLVHSIKKNYESKIVVPDGYEIDFIPKNEKIDNVLFSLKYNTEQKGNKILVSLFYHFKKPVYAADEYNYVKYCFKKIIEKGNKKIVLKMAKDKKCDEKFADE